LATRYRWNARLSSAAKDGDTLIVDSPVAAAVSVPLQNNQMKIIEISSDTLDIYQDLVIDSCIFAINTFFNSKSIESNGNIVINAVRWAQKRAKNVYIRNLVGNFRRVSCKVSIL